MCDTLYKMHPKFQSNNNTHTQHPVLTRINQVIAEEYSFNCSDLTILTMETSWQTTFGYFTDIRNSPTVCQVKVLWFNKSMFKYRGKVITTFTTDTCTIHVSYWKRRHQHNFDVYNSKFEPHINKDSPSMFVMWCCGNQNSYYVYLYCILVSQQSSTSNCCCQNWIFCLHQPNVLVTLRNENWG